MMTSFIISPQPLQAQRRRCYAEHLPADGAEIRVTRVLTNMPAESLLLVPVG